MTSYTAAGLPYPSPQDAVCDTDKYIRDLAAAAGPRITNRGLAVWRGVIVTNGSGDANVNITSLAAVTGAFATSIQLAPGGTNPIPLVAAVAGVSGTTVTLRWFYAPTSGGYMAGTYANLACDASVIAWGTPK